MRTVNDDKIVNKAPICSMCGKELDDCDLDADFSFERYIGFGSRYDMSVLDFKLCCDCFDKTLDTVLPMFKFNPLSEYEIISDGGKLIAKRKEEDK